MPLKCPACAADALQVWWSAFDPAPSYPAYEDRSPRVLLADATHACPACDWHGAPALGSDDIIEAVADLLIVERVVTLAEVAVKLSAEGTDVTIAEKVPTRSDRNAGVILEAAGGRVDLAYPFRHWRVRRSLGYLVAWAAGER